MSQVYTLDLDQRDEFEIEAMEAWNRVDTSYFPDDDQSTARRHPHFFPIMNPDPDPDPTK